MAIVIDSLTSQEVDIFLGQLVTIYRHAFSKPPYCKEEAEIVDFTQSLPRHVEKEGFRIVVAFEDRTDQMVGFAYGLANTPDQLWYEEVAKAVEPWMVKEWLTGSFRLVEIAVTPEAQGQGVGGLLHDCLLRKQSYQKAVLSTMAAETSAYWMYHERGWGVLLDNFLFPGVTRLYRIMGLELNEVNAV